MINTQLQRVGYWMHQLKSLTNNNTSAPIFLIGTHADNVQCTREYSDQLSTQLLTIFPKQRFHGLQGVFFVSCKTGQGIPELKIAVENAALSRKAFPVATSWVQLHDFIVDAKSPKQLEKKPIPTIRWSEYEQWAARCGIPDEELMLATRFLSDVGTIVCFFSDSMADQNRSQQDIVILDPQWYSISLRPSVRPSVCLSVYLPQCV
jgi:hypothetical protein